jgi:glycosyltransferase involved in cell wall biosynthesis
MRILNLAPHPFLQERGSPIDNLLVLKVLTEREHTKVDVLVYHEGADVNLPNLRLYRIPNMPFVKNIRPGLSVKKLVCDVVMFFQAWVMVHRGRYDLVHAVEEAVFMAMFFKAVYKIPYVYDLDSSLAQQLVESVPILGRLSPLFNWMERHAIKNSMANIPVCKALAELCEKNESRKTFILPDISQLKNPYARATGMLKEEIGTQGLVLLYCGNLNPYQGIDLLLESFKLAGEKTNSVDLAIIGGMHQDIERYQAKAVRLGVSARTHFLGSKPFDQLDRYLAEADILVSPRTGGINTPMKIFPYLHSGKSVLATDLYTHAQVITKKEAYLAPPTPVGFSKGILDLVDNEDLRKRLGANGRKLVEKNHTYSDHKKRLNGIYDWVEEQCKKRSSRARNVLLTA